ncbi:hypothetical protein LPJ53_003902 [Coemansia erecta]|uniref:Uncharacterized protein n=1 Tax=Coemansia erecta TaxID=147472 RepID=A0A9W7XVD2_9FUNG|nr:hypothetical protein LPJ53_003902 [Coemansia erecta]
MTLLWQYFAGDETPPEYPTAGHTMPDALSASDAASSSWCSVQRPGAAKGHIPPPALPAIPAHQRVASWLAQQGAVHYRASDGAAVVAVAASAVRSGGPPASDVSLGDFLRCSAPYRPSFMDRPSACMQTAPEASGETAAADIPERMQSTMADTGRPEQLPLQDAAPAIPAAPAAAAATTTTAESEGDADFLHHAFGHFVAFQPLDFARHRTSAAAPEGNDSGNVSGDDDEDDDDDGLCGETCVGHGSRTEQQTKSLWAYFADVVDEMTRDVTFIQ